MIKQRCSGAELAEFDDFSVTIECRRTYRTVEVAEYLCGICKRRGLVRVETLDNPDLQNRLPAELTRAGFCGDAIQVAPYNEGNPSLSTEPISVIQ